MLFWNYDDDDEQFNLNKPVLILRLRLKLDQLDEFISIYDKYFLPVDQITREVSRFLHDTRSHWNFTILYKYNSISDFDKRHQNYINAWRLKRKSKSDNEARMEIVKYERELYQFVEDDERIKSFQMISDSWQKI